MEAVIFIGIQGSGKSSFYRERFFDTHVRINPDMLKTKHRQHRKPPANVPRFLLCIESQSRERRPTA